MGQERTAPLKPSNVNSFGLFLLVNPLGRPITHLSPQGPHLQPFFIMDKERRAPLKPSNDKSLLFFLPCLIPGKAYLPCLTQGTSLTAPKQPKTPPR